MTVKGGSRPACAACRFQRRRCTSDCPLAPYFPATDPQVFQNVHNLYGVGHVMKILNSLQNDDDKDEAMTSIKYESNIRKSYPVDGCYGVIQQYKRQIVEAVEELRYVCRLLDAYKKNCTPVHNVDERVVGGPSDWINAAAVVNGGGDLGLYYNALSGGIGGYDQMKPTVEVTPSHPRRLNEFQRFGVVDEDEESPDYEDMLCRSFVDYQESPVGPKEAGDLKLESLNLDS